MKSAELIRSLSSQEAALFLNQLKTSANEHSGELVTMFSLIRSEKPLSRDDIFERTFKNRRYNDKLWRYRVSELNKSIEYFLMIKKLEQDAMLSGLITASVLRDKSCDKAYNHIHIQLTKRKEFEDAAYRLRMYEHHEQHLNYTTKKSSRKVQPDYSDTLFNLDVFYIQKKLQLACEVTNMANILQKKYEILLLKEIRNLASTPLYSDVFHIHIYDRILEMLLDSENENAFIQVQKLLVVNGNKINPPELGEMYQYLRNYCVGKINRGNTHYVRILFDIYKDMLSNRSLMSYEYLSQWEFKNIVTISLRLGENTWCKNFIRDQIGFLKPDERKNALAYNTAYFYFMNNEFNKAIRKLQETELKDVFYQLDARVIILKSYYELIETEAFFYHASAFRLFLLRNKNISDYQKTIYRNLIKYLTAILRTAFSKTKLKRIKSEIEKEKNIADINWLMTKLDQALA